MGSSEAIYRANHRVDNIPACSFDADFFKKFSEILSAINQKDAKLESEALSRKEGESDEDFTKRRKRISDLCKMQVLIYGSKGEFFSSETLSVFENPSLPSSHDTIVYENSSHYQFYLKVSPRNSFKVEFDFTRPQVFDLNVNPSMPTQNLKNWDN